MTAFTMHECYRRNPVASSTRAAADIAPVSDLDPMTVPYPAILEGVIRAPSGESLSGTVVRAWVPVKDPSDAGKAIGLIQIGETLAGPNGSYVLPLPPSISE